jgi:hypothetical protein
MARSLGRLRLPREDDDPRTIKTAENAPRWDPPPELEPPEPEPTDFQVR